MSEKRKRGGQPGNLNALTSGLYSQSLHRSGQLQLSQARTLDATDLMEEIAILRQRGAELLQAHPEAYELFCKIMREVIRAVAVQYAIRGTAAAQLEAACEIVIADLRTLILAEAITGD